MTAIVFKFTNDVFHLWFLYQSLICVCYVAHKNLTLSGLLS